MNKFVVKAGYHEWLLLRVAEGQLVADGQLIGSVGDAETGENVESCASLGELHSLCEESINALNNDLEEKEKADEVDEETGEVFQMLTDEECKLATEACFEAWKTKYCACA